VFTFFKHSAELASTGTILRVLSADGGLLLRLEPSLVVFDEVAVRPNDRLWNAMSRGSGTCSHPMIAGIPCSRVTSGTLGSSPGLQGCGQTRYRRGPPDSCGTRGDGLLRRRGLESDPALRPVLILPSSVE
jgi:hypothetical protein